MVSAKAPFSSAEAELHQPGRLAARTAGAGETSISVAAIATMSPTEGGFKTKEGESPSL